MLHITNTNHELDKPTVATGETGTALASGALVICFFSLSGVRVVHVVKLHCLHAVPDLGHMRPCAS